MLERLCATILFTQKEFGKRQSYLLFFDANFCLLFFKDPSGRAWISSIINKSSNSATSTSTGGNTTGVLPRDYYHYGGVGASNNNNTSGTTSASPSFSQLRGLKSLTGGGGGVEALVHQHHNPAHKSHSTTQLHGRSLDVEGGMVSGADYLNTSRLFFNLKAKDWFFSEGDFEIF